MAATRRRVAPKPSAPSLDDAMRQTLTEIRLMEGSARILQSRLDIVSAAMSETQTAISTLEGVRGVGDGSELLLPIGSGSFVKGKLTGFDRIIIGIGASVCVEKTVEDSLKDLRVRNGELDRARNSVAQQLGQILGSIEDYRARLNDLVQKKGGGSVEIV